MTLFKKELLSKLFFCFILLGSNLLTSQKFYNEYNIRSYFIIISVLFVVGIYALCLKYLTQLKYFPLNLFYCSFLMIVLFSWLGIFQYFGLSKSWNTEFHITGTFDNPAGFAAVLAIAFPIGIYLWLKVRLIWQKLVTLGLLSISVAVVLSGSRTGIVSIFLATLVYVLIEPSSFLSFKKLRRRKYWIYISIIVFIIGVTWLYFNKKDSADGRLLIWKVSLEMIKDKPVLGHGIGAFKAMYMQYQGNYFAQHPNSKFAMLADNVKHPFNEFIKIGVEYGMLGLIILIGGIFILFYKVIYSSLKYKSLVLSGLSAVIVVSCFSYPFKYVAVWLLIALYLYLLLPQKEIKLGYSPFMIVLRIAVVMFCIYGEVCQYKKMKNELKWKQIATESLYGKTKQMLTQYEVLYKTLLKKDPFFLYNFGAELNVANEYERSIEILKECQTLFNDYDLQILLADNYYKKGDYKNAINKYVAASYMIPCRFMPLYQLFELYKELGQDVNAKKYAQVIVEKKVKIESVTVSSIKALAEEYLDEN